MAISFGPIFNKKYRVTRSYKDHPKFGCPGPDFATPMGTPLKAVFDGTVVSGVNPDIPGRIDPKEDWGKYIWLTSSANKRVKVGYAHLSKFRVRSGKVKKGQIIAYSGNSGYSFGAHLHFALSYYGNCVDPLNNPNVVRWTQVTDMIDKKYLKDKLFKYKGSTTIYWHIPSLEAFKKYIAPTTVGIKTIPVPNKSKLAQLNSIIKNNYITKVVHKKLAGNIERSFKGTIDDLTGEKERCRDKGVGLVKELSDLDKQIKGLKEEIKIFKEPKTVKIPRVSKKDGWWGKFWKKILQAVAK